MKPKSNGKLIALFIVLVVIAGSLAAYSQSNNDGDVPASFDMRDSYTVTPVKNQGMFGTCWAFGMSGALESEILLENGGSEMVYISPMYLAEAVYDSTSYDKSLDEDQVVFTSSNSVAFTGGNFTLVVYPAAAGKAITTEIVAPYHDMEEYIDRSTMTEVDSYLVISGIECLDSYKDAKAIKQHLLNGEAGAFIYEAAQNLNAVGLSTCDNSTNMDCDYANHMVTIMGWDDNFSKDNFKVKPKCDGAWLIKNSWGTGGSMKDGYQWISYECTIGGVVFYSSVDIQDGSKILYSYDNGYAIKSDLALREKASMANIFQAESNQTLTGTSFITMDNTYNPLGEKYTVNVYSLGSGFKNPIDGTLLYSTSGTVTVNGLFNVDFEKGIHLNDGQYFSIVIDLEKENGVVVVPLDVTEDSYYYTSYSVSHAGESWLDDGSGWKDLSASGDTNIRIKAYATADSPVKAQIVSDNGSIIGSYATLEDAVAAYSSGTIVLKSNIDAAGPITVDREMSFNLNGFTISFPAMDGAAIKAVESLKMKNGTIEIKGVGGIASYADIELDNIAVNSLSTDKSVLYIALMAEGANGAEINVKLSDFYTDDYYDGDDYESYRFGAVYITKSNVEMTSSFVGIIYADTCKGLINDTTTLDIRALSSDMVYKDLIIVNEETEFAVPGYVLTKYVNGTCTFGEPVAVDSNGTEYSNLLYALDKGVGTVTLVRDVVHTVYNNNYTLKVANEYTSSGQTITKDITTFDLAGHSLKVLRGTCALSVGAALTLDNSGGKATVTCSFSQAAGVIAIAFGNLTITGSDIVLKSDTLVPGVKIIFGVLKSEDALKHEEKLDKLGITVTKTYVADPDHVKNKFGYYYTVSGKSEDGKISYSGTCEPYVDDKATSISAMAGIDEIYDLTGTYVGSGKVAVTMKEYYENGLRITEITRDGVTDYVVSANKNVNDSAGKAIGSVVASYKDHVLTVTVYGVQGSQEVSDLVWKAAIDYVDAVSSKVGSDLHTAVVEVSCYYSSKNVPANVVDQLIDRGVYFKFALIVDADSYKGTIPSWKLIDYKVDVMVKLTEAFRGKTLTCNVDVLTKANSSSDVIDMVGNDRAWKVVLKANGKPVCFDEDIVYMLIPYEDGVLYYGADDAVAKLLETKRMTVDGIDCTAIPVYGPYIWESAADRTA